MMEPNLDPNDDAATPMATTATTATTTTTIRSREHGGGGGRDGANKRKKKMRRVVRNRNNRPDDDDDEEMGSHQPCDVTTVTSTTTKGIRHSKGPLATTEHLGKNRQYWRDIILGVNDGIVSTFLLVMGVAGGGLSSRDIFLTSIAGALAGAVSMFSGEFVATKSQNEVLQGEIILEQSHVQKYPHEEMEELEGLLDLIGIPPTVITTTSTTAATKSDHDDQAKEEHKDDDNDDQRNDETDRLRPSLIRYYGHNSDALLKVMIALEFGVIEEEMRSPIWAGLTSLTSYVVGSLPSVVPFAFAKHANTGLIAAAVATIVALIMVGLIKTWATRGGYCRSAGENVMIASVGAGLAYAVGLLFHHVAN